MAFSVLFWPVIAGFGVLAVLVAILVFAFWVWMIVDCARREFGVDWEKIVWLVIIVFTGWLGALIYFIVIRS